MWELADEDGDGRLTKAEFLTAMKFCRMALGGHALPPLPSSCS